MKDIKILYHGTTARETIIRFDYDKIGSSNGTDAGQGFYVTEDKNRALSYAKSNKSGLYRVVVNLSPDRLINPDKVTFNRSDLSSILRALQAEGLDYLSNYGEVEFEGYNVVLNRAIDDLITYNDSDVEIVGSIMNSLSGHNKTINKIIKVATNKTYTYDNNLVSGYKDYILYDNSADTVLSIDKISA